MLLFSLQCKEINSLFLYPVLRCQKAIEEESHSFLESLCYIFVKLGESYLEDLILQPELQILTLLLHLFKAKNIGK